MTLPVLKITKNWFTGTTVIEGDWDNIRNPLLSWASKINLAFNQVSVDAFGSTYNINNSGTPELPVSLQDQINAIVSGGAAIIGTANPTWTIHFGFAERAILDTTGLTGARTFTFPDVSNLLVGATAVQNISGKTFTDTIVWNSGTAFTGTLDHNNTANRVYTFPDISGTVALATAPIFLTNVDVYNGFDFRAFSDTGITQTAGIDGATGNAFFNGDISWLSATAFAATLDHANTAIRTYTFPDASGNVPSLPTAATSETGTGAIVRANAPTFAGNVNMGSHLITNVTNPVSPQDAATRNYVDSGFPSNATYNAHTHPIAARMNRGSGTLTLSRTGGVDPDTVTGTITLVVTGFAASDFIHPSVGSVTAFTCTQNSDHPEYNHFQITYVSGVFAAGNWTFTWNCELGGLSDNDQSATFQIGRAHV